MRIIIYELIGANINFPIIPKTINNRNAGEIEEAQKKHAESYTIEIQKSREINKKEAALQNDYNGKVEADRQNRYRFYAKQTVSIRTHLHIHHTRRFAVIFLLSFSLFRPSLSAVKRWNMHVNHRINPENNKKKLTATMYCGFFVCVKLRKIKKKTKTKRNAKSKKEKCKLPKKKLSTTKTRWSLLDA